MRWYLDEEFDENGSTIKLISIGLVSEAGDEYYRILSDGWDPAHCNKWVRTNVLPHLSGITATRAVVAEDIRGLLLANGDRPEIWGYFSDYDWVAFCQLFGTMMQLPEGFPRYCLDIKQEMKRLGVSRDMLPKQEGQPHNALEDARWNRVAHLWLRDYEAAQKNAPTKLGKH